MNVPPDMAADRPIARPGTEDRPIRRACPPRATLARVRIRGVVLVFGSLFGSAPGATHPSEAAFEIAERDLLPESIAHDPHDGAFYVGSMHKRKIVRIDRTGEVTDFVAPKADGLWGVLGMKVDPSRRELWVATCNLGPDQRPPMIDPEPATAGRTAVHRYDLRTGALVRRYEPVNPPPMLCWNDLVQTVDGDVYLSSGPTGVWRIAADAGAAEAFTPSDGRFGNGIAASPDGRTLYLAVHDQGIVTIDVATRAIAPLPAPEGPHVMGIDGLYVHDGTLVGIQNGTKVPRVLRATLAESGAAIDRVEVLEEDHPRFAVPTTGVIVDDDLFYVATSQLDSIDPQTNEIVTDMLVPNVILRLSLAGPEAIDPASAISGSGPPAAGCASRR